MSLRHEGGLFVTGDARLRHVSRASPRPKTHGPSRCGGRHANPRRVAEDARTLGLSPHTRPSRWRSQPARTAIEKAASLTSGRGKLRSADQAGQLVGETGLAGRSQPRRLGQPKTGPADAGPADWRPVSPPRRRRLRAAGRFLRRGLLLRPGLRFLRRLLRLRGLRFLRLLRPLRGRLRLLLLR
jgi:hypothetical protein